MADSIRLTDAIKANENGIKNLESNRDYYRKIEKVNKENADRLSEEIVARLDMLGSMRRLQAVYPDNQTIRFTIP